MNKQNAGGERELKLNIFNTVFGYDIYFWGKSQ